ncbi:DUF1648 domain-containing protein [Bacillus aerolatus]|uniref:DUF1648 domain-containing protein n=1 Tax=Bacillus aerolatus TaxID=2653354 RepID=A0A6I1FIN1_9BACI|nr:DUF1648 domain-containing protein [Bacillus aerolatus]KAB7705949.1 DUF1648 domain-containing protein [Bacillus aerolatus]
MAKLVYLPKTSFEKISTIVSLLLIIGNVIYLLIQWSTLPDQVPIHFNAKGEADGWGGKGMIWFVPAVTLLLWAGLTALERVPHVYNIPNLTEENKERQYVNSRMMFNVLKMELVFFLVYTSWQSVQWAHGNETGIGCFELPVFLTVILGTMGVFLFRAYKIK